MSLMLTRMFAYFTLAAYLVVGTLVVRFYAPEMSSVSFTTSYLNLVSDAEMKVAVSEPLNVPEMQFAEIKIPVAPVVKKLAVLKAQPKVQQSKLEVVKVSLNELPFHEPVKLEKISMKEELPTNMVALYKEFSFSESLVAESVVDEVSTSQAAVTDAEPEFFEYPTTTAEKSAAVQPEEVSKKIETAASEEIETQNIDELIEAPSTTPTAAVAEVEPEFFEYTKPVTTQTEKVTAAPVAAAHAPIAMAPLAFDYSKANQAISQGIVPTVSKVSSQKTKPIQTQRSNPVSQPEEEIQTDKKGKMVSHSFPSSVSIRALGSDLKITEELQGFEVRFQDDLSETVEDFGAGEVRVDALLSQPKMTRSVTVLKRGFVPTTAEVVFDDGGSSSFVPMIQDEVFNDVQQAFERRGSVGALLVELADETDVAKLDVPFGTVIKLNQDMKKTDGEDFVYQLFVGVQAGNAMVSYHRGNNEVVTKIVHVHENELTFDKNMYEEVVNEKVRLYEDNLLSKESSPLIISGEQVKVFASNSIAKKINNQTYKMNFTASHLGGRRYLELNHHNEPVFVGIRDNIHVTVPSETFMRHILSKLEGSKLANRCLVQVNLSKKIEKVAVASESVASSLMVHTQMLDSDGMFYDSASDKTEKVIIVGDSQGTGDTSPDAKVNIKIQYQDGSVQFLNSYCSPNTYLVEQL